MVTAGKQYDLSLWYKTTTPDASLTLFRHDTTAGWQYWTDLKTLDLAAGWTQAGVRTPEVPAGTDRISWGVSVYGTGSATTDDYTMEQVADPVPDPECTGTAEECANGRWDVLPTRNPVRSMHSVVLHNGKVLLIAGSRNDPERFEAGTFTSAVYDPVAGTYKTIRRRRTCSAPGTCSSAHVHSFAETPVGKVTGPGKERTSQPVGPTVSGCDRHYGSANVCVPTAFPAEGRKTAAARCDWLARNDYGRLKVNGKDDPLRLDRNRDGRACGKGDR